MTKTFRTMVNEVTYVDVQIGNDIKKTEPAIGMNGYNNAIEAAKKIEGKVQPAVDHNGWEIVDAKGDVVGHVKSTMPEDVTNAATLGSGTDAADATGATNQNLPASINSTTAPLNTNVSEKVNIVNFLKLFSEKNYAEANKYLENIIHSKLKERIKVASQKPLF